MSLYIFIFIFTFIFTYNIFLYLFRSKINNLERNINNLFQKRISLLPCLHEVSKDYVVRHSDVFSSTLETIRENSISSDYDKNFDENIHKQSIIHNNIDFLFRIFNKHYKLINNYKFIYVKDQIINSSFEIWERIKLYKNIIKKYNKLLRINHFLLVWYLIPYDYKREI